MHQRFDHLKVGDPVPLAPGRKMQEGEPLDRPLWFALVTPPQRELAARGYLRTNGIEAFFPSEEVRRQIWGKRRSFERPIVGGYVFSRFRLPPQWDVIRSRPYFTGVVGLGVVPYVIPKSTIRRLRGLTVEVKLREEEKREAYEAMRRSNAAVARALAPREGERAEIVGGALSGFVVDVTRVRGDMASILLPGGVKAQAEVNSLRREGVDLSRIPGYVPPASP